MKTFLKHLKDSWKNLKDYRNWIVLTVIIDFVALIAFAKVYIYVWTKAMVHLETILGALGEEALRDTAALTSASVEFASQYQALMKYAWILLVSAILIWAISQGINWFICSKIAMRKKMDLKFFQQHMLKFFILSVVWTVGFLLITYLSVRIGVSFLSAIGSFNQWIIAILFLLLGYFGLVSYGIVPKYHLKEIIQKTFKTGVKHYQDSSKLYLFSMILMVIFAFIMAQIFAFNAMWALAFFVIVFLPAFSYIRILYVKVLEKIKN